MNNEFETISNIETFIFVFFSLLNIKIIKIKENKKEISK